jgi:hypothetical protein
MKQARAGKIYDESCNELLERFVAETFADEEEHSRDEITSWFAANYPLFKPITVQCHIEKYTTNFRSRVHYNARPPLPRRRRLGAPSPFPVGPRSRADSRQA